MVMYVPKANAVMFLEIFTVLRSAAGLTVTVEEHDRALTVLLRSAD